jgi:hypothetical protein
MRHDYTNGKLADVPFVEEVCSLFDLYILQDIEALSDAEDETRVKAVLAIGAEAEPEAGLYRCTLTPWFGSLEELNAFCEKHIERFRAEADNSDTIPDATEWAC